MFCPKLNTSAKRLITGQRIKNMNAEIQKLEQLLATALLQRKQANKLRLPRTFVLTLGTDIRNLRSQIADLTAKAGN
jgi:hypothetical protein